MADGEQVRVSAKDEREKIVEALRSSDYVVSRAAVALGWSATTTRRRIAEHGLERLLVQHSQRIRRRREGSAPHDVSRQAQDQQINRLAGLCGCGRPPAPRRDGSPGRMCELCRDRARDAKRRTA